MFAVLMAGGVGTRFWPMSRKAYPKQLLNFSGTKSMLQKTYDRIKPLTADENILVVTSTDLKKSIEEKILRHALAWRRRLLKKKHLKTK
jgi:mannose-1-phosphate guanylyltransferase